MILTRLDAEPQRQRRMLRHRDESWPLRVVNQFGSLEEFKRFPITSDGLRLEDVATIALTEPELDYGRHLDRGRAIGLNVIKESGANTVAVAERANAVMRELDADPMLRGVRVITFTDQAEQIRTRSRPAPRRHHRAAVHPAALLSAAPHHHAGGAAPFSVVVGRGRRLISVADRPTSCHDGPDVGPPAAGR
jgi:hypothetical protein